MVSLTPNRNAISPRWHQDPACSSELLRASHYFGRGEPLEAMVARATTTGAAPRAKGAAATSGRARTSLPTPASRLSRPGETTGRTPHLLRLRANPDGGEDAEESSSGGKGKPFFDLSVGDELLDFLEAGPKMRKWYGAPEKGTDTLDLTPKTAKAKSESTLASLPAVVIFSPMIDSDSKLLSPSPSALPSP